MYKRQVIGVGYPRPVITLRLVAVGIDLFPQPVIPAIEIAGHPSCRIGDVYKRQEQADPGCIFLLYYTALTVIRKLVSICLLYTSRCV